MSKSPVRKTIGLVALYSIIIIGIFVLQFRNESVLSKNTGLLSISLAQSQAEDGTTSLKNTLAVNFKGISFFSDEVHPAYVNYNGKNSALILESYEQPTNLSYKFNFSDDTSLTFAVSDATSDAELSISASLPKDATGLSLYYKPAAGFSVTDKTRTKLQLNSKNLSYIFTAAQISDEEITFTPRNTLAYYNIYDPTIAFSFASIESDIAISQKSTYDENIRQFKNNLVSSVADAIQNSQSLSEKTYIAYVAELASRGRFAEAVKYVPDSFKRGSQRTYLSAPYFNNLQAMYPSLAMHNDNMSNMISNAISSKSLSIFTAENLAEYINILSDAQKVNNLLSIPQQILSQEENRTTAEPAMTLSQAVGILNVYVKLSLLHSSAAEILSSAIEKCLEVIQESCVLNDSTLTLHDKDSLATAQLSLETGNALLQLGEFNSSDDYKRAGYALINTVLSGTQLDANALGNAYPVLVSNPAYPHYAVLQRTASKTIWAWTCAQNIGYATSANANSATISVKFDKGESHYVIFSGIPSFTEIEIYGLSYHSDPRFESYNSSGFIYRESTSTLFLKSRQKSETETIRLTFGRNAPRPAQTTRSAAAQTQNAQNSDSANATTNSAAENSGNAENAAAQNVSSESQSAQ